MASCSPRRPTCSLGVAATAQSTCSDMTGCINLRCLILRSIYFREAVHSRSQRQWKQNSCAPYPSIVSHCAA